MIDPDESEGVTLGTLTDAMTPTPEWQYVSDLIYSSYH